MKVERLAHLLFDLPPYVRRLDQCNNTVSLQPMVHCRVHKTDVAKKDKTCSTVDEISGSVAERFGHKMF